MDDPDRRTTEVQLITTVMNGLRVLQCNNKSNTPLLLLILPPSPLLPVFIVINSLNSVMFISNSVFFSFVRRVAETDGISVKVLRLRQPIKVGRETKRDR